MTTKTTTAGTTTTPKAPRTRRAATKPVPAPTTRKRAPKAAQATTAGPAERLAAAAEAVNQVKAQLVAAQAQRDALVAELISSKTLSGPQVGKIIGMTPMGVYNAARRSARA